MHLKIVIKRDNRSKIIPPVNEWEEGREEKHQTNGQLSRSRTERRAKN